MPAGDRGDVTRLRQMLVNLLVNAVKFTERGEVVLTVSATRRERRTPSSRFAVRDTGIGIPPDGIGRLFQSFSQVDASTTRQYGGTGLGLAISKRLAELMGGTMWVESDGPGRGSTFRFTIQRPAAELPAQGRRESSARSRRSQGRRVLVVDDNATNRRMLACRRPWGMVPRDTESPDEALRWIAAGEAFDLAILDMHMPRDGRARAGAADPRGATRDCRWCCSARSAAQGAGDTDGLFGAYLAKPLRQSQLFDALVTLLAHERRRRPPAAAKPRLDAAMAQRHPLRILLAEDNAVNQKLALRMLQQMGYRADVASNGIEAVEAVERQPYDVVLMDVQMPEMDGLEAARRDPRALARRRAAAHRRDDRQRDAGRPRAVPRGGHGRLPHQADPRRASWSRRLRRSSRANAAPPSPRTTERPGEITDMVKRQPKQAGAIAAASDALPGTGDRRDARPRLGRAARPGAHGGRCRGRRTPLRK